MYTKILVYNKDLIKKSVTEREADAELMSKGFLFENYKPECWWYEIVETIRRLMLTSVLGLIEPGTDSQLAVGTVLSVFGYGFSCYFRPYLEARDNLLSILSSLQIFVIMLIALVLKRSKGLPKEESSSSSSSFDDKYLGYVLIALNCVMVAVFIAYGYVVQFVKRSRKNEDRSLGRASSGVYDIFSGLRASLGWLGKEKPLAIDDGQKEIELSDIFSGGEDGSKTRGNPIHEKRSGEGWGVNNE